MIAVTIAIPRFAAVLFAATGVALVLLSIEGCTAMAPQYAAQQYAPSYYEGGYNTLTPQQKFQLEDHLSNQSNEAWRKENLNRFQLAAELWAQNPSPDLLVRGEVLDEGEQWAKHRKAMLTKEELDFLRACQDARRAVRHRTYWILSMALLLLLAAGYALAWKSETFRPRTWRS